MSNLTSLCVTITSWDKCPPIISTKLHHNMASYLCSKYCGEVGEIPSIPAIEGPTQQDNIVSNIAKHVSFARLNKKQVLEKPQCD